MKIQAQSSLLLRQALQKSAKCIDPKNAIAILGNVLLTQKDGKFFFISATADSQLKVPAPFSIVEGDFKNDVVLPINNILSLLSTLPGDSVLTFELSDVQGAHGMTIEYCTHNGSTAKPGKVSMVFESAIDFPVIAPFSNGISHISLPMPVFKNVLSHAGKFVANSELRPVMNCLCIDEAEDFSQVTFVASTGHILLKVIHTNDPKTGGSEYYREGKASKILLHSSYLKIFSVFDACESIDIEDNENVIRFTADDMELICKKVDGGYPNYNSVIPRDNPYSIVMSKQELVNVVKRVALFSSESSNMISLQKKGMFLNVHAEDIDFSTFADDQVLITDSNCPEDFRIGFKASSLLDCVAVIPGDDIRLELTDSSRAGIFVPNETSPKQLALLIPMLLND